MYAHEMGNYQKICRIPKNDMRQITMQYDANRKTTLLM